MSEREMTGGCQCGRVRYTAKVDPAKAYLCHCNMCKRATGGVSAAFVGLPLADMTWETQPEWYHSSPIAKRPFCSTCGTPLGFQFSKDAINLDVTVGSFDDPSPFRPYHNYASESILPEWLDVSHLPMMRTDENGSVADRWKAAGLEPPS